MSLRDIFKCFSNSENKRLKIVENNLVQNSIRNDSKSCLTIIQENPSINLKRALFYAAVHNNTETLILFIKHGADIDNGALYHSSRLGNFEAVSALLSAGANPNTGNSLSVAVGNGHSKVTSKLLAYGADSSLVTNHSIEHATKNGYSETLEILSDWKIKYNIPPRTLYY